MKIFKNQTQIALTATGLYTLDCNTLVCNKIAYQRGIVGLTSTGKVTYMQTVIRSDRDMWELDSPDVEINSEIKILRRALRVISKG